MATLTGNDGAVSVAGTNLAAVRNFSVDVVSDTIESTTMGNDTRQYLKGLSSYSGSADIYFDTTEFDDSTVSNALNPTSGAVGDAPIAMKLYIDDDASNDVILWANTVIVTGFSVTSSMDGMVEASLSFQGSGALGYSNTGTY